MATKAGLSEVVAMGGNVRVSPAVLADSVQVRLQRMYQGSRYFTQTNTVAVPMPVINGEPMDDAALISWTNQLLVAIFGAQVAEGAGDTATTANP